MPSRTARYSAAGSPNVVTQSHPASSSKPTADFEVMAWNAVSLLWLNQAPPGLGGADDYAAQYRWGDEQARDGSAADVAAAVQAELTGEA